MDTLPGKFFQRELGINNRPNFSYKSQLSTLRSTARISLLAHMRDSGDWEGPRPSANPVYSMEFNPHTPALLAVTDEVGAITLINTKEGVGGGIVSCQRVIQNAVNRLSWSQHQPTILATASCSQTVDIWDVNDFHQIASYTGHTKTVKSVKFHPTQPEIVVSGGRDGCVMLWDTRQPSSSIPVNLISNAHSFIFKITTKQKKLTELCLPVTDLVIKDDHTLISCGATDGLIKFWDLRRTYKYMSRAEPVQVFKYPSKLVEESGDARNSHSLYGVGYSGMKLDSENNLYVSTSTRDIFKYNLSNTDSQEPVARYTRSGTHSAEYGVNVDVSKDGRFLISGSGTPYAYIWDTWNTSKEACVRLEGTDELGSLSTVLFSPLDPLTLVTGGDDSVVTIWRADPLKEFREVNPESNVNFEPTCTATSMSNENEQSSSKPVIPKKSMLPKYRKPNVDPFNLAPLLQDLPNFVINGLQPHLPVKHEKSRDRPALTSWLHSSNLSEKRAWNSNGTEPPRKRLKVTKLTATTPEPKPRRLSRAGATLTPKSRSGRKNGSTTPSASPVSSPNSPSIRKYFTPVINASPSLEIQLTRYD